METISPAGGTDIARRAWQLIAGQVGQLFVSVSRRASAAKSNLRLHLGQKFYRCQETEKVFRREFSQKLPRKMQEVRQHTALANP
jgi:hypothetical protein